MKNWKYNFHLKCWEPIPYTKNPMFKNPSYSKYKSAANHNR